MSGRTFRTGLAAAALAFAVAGSAQAQSMSTSAAQYNAGYGRTYGQENQPVAATTRDANGNRVILDGIIQTGSDQSIFARAGAWGAADAFAGAGALGGATAIGNNLVVITQGNWNTVIVNSTQNNSGPVTANSDLNGKIVLDGPH
jgi:holdfast attachment protein HfaA